jgi:hypothetical protein
MIPGGPMKINAMNEVIKEACLVCAAECGVVVMRTYAEKDDEGTWHDVEWQCQACGNFNGAEMLFDKDYELLAARHYWSWN